MGRYTKRPVTIDAVQLRDDNDDEILAFFNEFACPFEIVGDHEVDIHTLVGTMHADKGDWIIRGVKGGFYSCKPDIFYATYDLPAQKGSI